MKNINNKYLVFFLGAILAVTAPVIPVTAHAAGTLETPKIEGVDRKNISVDDEIRKLEMPTFRNVRALRVELADNVKQRDDFLDFFKTITGISMLTLSYLDKTVAAGLTNQAMITDNKVTQHLLKQISWATNEIARPDRKQLYRDFNEKIEYCLVSYEEGGNNVSEYGKEVGNKIKNQEKQVCKSQCGEPDFQDMKKIKWESGTTGGTSGSEKGKKRGIYDYCVCCAEVMVKTNNDLAGITGTTGDSQNNKAVSLFDKLFFGNKKTDGDADLKKEVQGMRAMYGDIMYNKDNSADGQLIMTELADASIAALVYAIRDGKVKDFTGVNANAKKIFPDKIAGNDFKGVFPALVAIIKDWPPKDLSNPGEEFFKNWEQASLGKLLYGYDIESWLVFGKRPKGAGSSGNWDIDADANKTIKALCSYWAEASATSYVRSIHIRNKGRIEDFMALSNVLTEYEKEKIRGLISRVEKQFMMMEDLAVVERFAENKNIVAGMTQEKDRALSVSTLRMAIGSGIRTDRNTGFAGGVPNSE